MRLLDPEFHRNLQVLFSPYLTAADEGISGTAARNRPAFRQMLEDARAGRVDLILTREVSRFARNTVDALAHTRLLRRCGVGVVFLGDGIDTRQNDGEFRLAIMASVAQEESRKTSERVKWGQKRSMERGVVFGSGAVYGFSLLHGQLTVKEEEAAVVRTVYDKFLHEGKGACIIARELTEAGVPPPRAKDRPWSPAMVLRLLKNEKYCGDLLQKKSFTPDFLDHKRRVNRGEEAQVYLRGHHEAIVPREVFERVQRELTRRAPAGQGAPRPSARYWCSGKALCGCCGGRLVPRRRATAAGESCRWVCAARAKQGAQRCAMRPAAMDTLRVCMQAVLDALAPDADALVDRTLALLGAGTADIAREQARQRAQLTQKRADALDAWLAHRITRGELDAVCARCDARLAQLGEAAPVPPLPAQALRDRLRAEGLHCDAVYGALLERLTLREDGALVRICGVRRAFRLWFALPPRSRTLHRAAVRCEAEGDG